MATHSSPHRTADEQISTAAAISYWKEVPATVGGMLGGYPQVSKIDLRGSRVFVAKLRRGAASAARSSASAAPVPPLQRGVDCGAGIGRITAGFLSHICSTVDIVEPVPKFAECARSLTADDLGEGQIGKVFVCGLEQWDPDPQIQYDLMWHQWCLGHLNDAMLHAYLRRCQRALRPGGWVVVKENVSWPEDLYDDLDSTVTRTDASYREAFERAGMKVVRSELQKGFPPSLGLYPIRLYALQPAT